MYGRCDLLFNKRKTISREYKDYQCKSFVIPLSYILDSNYQFSLSENSNFVLNNISLMQGRFPHFGYTTEDFEQLALLLTSCYALTISIQKKDESIEILKNIPLQSFIEPDKYQGITAVSSFNFTDFLKADIILFSNNVNILRIEKIADPKKVARTFIKSIPDSVFDVMLEKAINYLFNNFSLVLSGFFLSKNVFFVSRNYTDVEKRKNIDVWTVDISPHLKKVVLLNESGDKIKQFPLLPENKLWDPHFEVKGETITGVNAKYYSYRFTEKSPPIDCLKFEYTFPTIDSDAIIENIEVTMADIPNNFILGNDGKGIILLPEGDTEDEEGNIVHYKIQEFFNDRYNVSEEDRNKSELPIYYADIYNYFSRKTIPSCFLPGNIEIQWSHGLFQFNVPTLVKIVGEDYQPTVSEIDKLFTQSFNLQEYRELKKGEETEKLFWKRSIFKKVKEKIYAAGANFSEDMLPQKITLYNGIFIQPEESGDVFPFVVQKGTSIKVSFYVPVDIIPDRGILKLKFTRM